jgi:glycosyltransferase involved in cell wall biosynthesis
LNVCLIPEKYPPDIGGLAVSARRLAGGLAARGHNVHVCHVTEALPPRHIEHTIEGDVGVHRLGAGRRTDDTLADWFDAIVALHRSHPLDVLHGYYLARAGYVCVLAARYLGRPSVVSARGNDLERTIFDPSRAGAILWALANADAVTAVSADGRCTSSPTGLTPRCLRRARWQPIWGWATCRRSASSARHV